MNLILIRHGEIDSNVAKIYSGRSSEPLNAKGIGQAMLAAEKVQGLTLAALYSSPLKRAIETATVIGQKTGFEPVVSLYFNELRMGPWEGLSEADVESRYPSEFRIWNTRPADLRLAGRESLQELQSRSLEGLLEIESLYGAAPVAIVSHVAVIRVLILHAEARPLNDYKSIAVPNASPIVLGLNPARPGPA